MRSHTIYTFHWVAVGDLLSLQVGWGSFVSCMLKLLEAGFLRFRLALFYLSECLVRFGFGFVDAVTAFSLRFKIHLESHFFTAPHTNKVGPAGLWLYSNSAGEQRFEIFASS